MALARGKAFVVGVGFGRPQKLATVIHAVRDASCWLLPVGAREQNDRSERVQCPDRYFFPSIQRLNLVQAEDVLLSIVAVHCFNNSGVRSECF
jgi:hypothetical protein